MPQDIEHLRLEVHTCLVNGAMYYQECINTLLVLSIWDHWYA